MYLVKYRHAENVYMNGSSGQVVGQRYATRFTSKQNACTAIASRNYPDQWKVVKLVANVPHIIRLPAAHTYMGKDLYYNPSLCVTVRSHATVFHSKKEAKAKLAQLAQRPWLQAVVEKA